jgi:CHAT domain-containing protein
LVNQSIVEAFGLPPKQGIAYFDRILQGLSSAGPSNVLAKLRVTRYAAEFEELSGMEDKAFQRLEAAAKQLGPMENCMEGKELLFSMLSVPLGQEKDDVVRALTRRLDRFYDQLGVRHAVAGWKIESGEDLLLLKDYGGGYARLLDAAAVLSKLDGATDPDWATVIDDSDDLNGDEAPPTVRAAFLAALTTNPEILPPSNPKFAELRWRLVSTLVRAGRPRDAAAIVRRTLAEQPVSEHLKRFVALGPDVTAPEIEWEMKSDPTLGVDTLRLAGALFQLRLREPQRDSVALWTASSAYARRLFELGMDTEGNDVLGELEAALLTDPARDRYDTSSILGSIATLYRERGAYDRAERTLRAGERELGGPLTLSSVQSSSIDQAPLNTLNATKSAGIVAILQKGLSEAAAAFAAADFERAGQIAVQRYRQATKQSKDRLEVAFSDYLTRFDLIFANPSTCPRDSSTPRERDLMLKCARTALSLLDLTLRYQMEETPAHAGTGIAAPGELAGGWSSSMALASYLKNFADIPGAVTDRVFESTLQHLAMETIDPTSTAIRWSLARQKLSDPTQVARLQRYQTELRRWLSRPVDEQPERFLYAAADVTAPEIDRTRPDPSDFQVAKLRAALGPEEALIVFRAFDQQVFAWVLTRRAAQIVPLPRRLDEVVADTSWLRASIDPDLVSGVNPAYPAARAYALYRTLFGPLLPLLSGIQDLLIVPDSSFANLPFGALVISDPKNAEWKVGDASRPEYFVERFSVSILPAIDALQALRSASDIPASIAGVLVLGDPDLSGSMAPEPAPLFVAGRAQPEVLRRFRQLPGTTAEIIAVKDALPRARVLSGPAFNEKSFNQLNGSFKAVLFATHATAARDGSPAFLLLTPPSIPTAEDDGALTGDEIANSAVRSEVIILSACETGAGTDRAGGYGELTSSFFANGTKAVVATHVKIADTARLMTVAIMIHSAQNGSRGLARRLRETAANLVKNPPQPQFQHPLYWAPFFLIGAPVQ